MNLVADIIGWALAFVGVIFMLIGSLGIIRLPDFFARTHAASKIDTVGVVFVLFGIAVVEGFTLTGGKVVLAAVFILITNPVAIHALARAALRQGMKPWRRGEPLPSKTKD